METKQAYNLFGFIDYSDLPIGFVTPVFQSNSGEKYVQNITFNNRRISWQKLAGTYSDMTYSIHYETILDSDAIIYGMKFRGEYIFGGGAEIEEYILRNRLDKENDYKELIQGFIDEWKDLELDSTPITKEEIWEKCIEIVAQESNTLPAIFQRGFTAVEFHSDKLILKSNNEQLTKVFRTQYQNPITSIISKEIANFTIEFTNSISDKISVIPFVYFGGKEESSYSKGATIIETNINSYQKFDNFIVAKFNSEAYHSSINFIQALDTPLMVIKGMSGLGKSHLVNSIANRYIETFGNNKVGFFRVMNNPIGGIEFSGQNLEQFKCVAAERDFILIDDIHKVEGMNIHIEEFFGMIKDYSAKGKKIAISFDQHINNNSARLDILRSSARINEVNIATPTNEDKEKIISAHTSRHNFSLPSKDLLNLSHDLKIRTVADIQHFILKALLSSEISSHLGYQRTVSLDLPIYRNNPQWIESSVDKYIWGLQHPSHALSILNTKAISRFISILFAPSSSIQTHPRASNIEFHGSYYSYSFDVLKYLLFKDETLREVVTDIVVDILKKKE